MKSKSTDIFKMEYLNHIICEKIDFLLDHYEIKYRRSSDFLVSSCPVHGGDNKTALNIFLNGHTRIGNWICYTHNCQDHFINTAIGFFRGVISNKRFGWSNLGDRKVSFDSAIFEICKLLDIDFSSIEQSEEYKSVEKHAHLFCKKTKTQKNNYTKKMIRDKLSIPSEYFVSRGHDPFILDKYDVGDSNSVDKLFNNRAVVPIYDSDNKKIIGFTGRIKVEKCIKCNNYHIENDCDLNKNVAKWLHSRGFSKSNHLYNYGNAKESIKKSGIAILVEGPADVWKFLKNGIENVVAVFGSSLSDGQQIILESSGATSLMLVFDSDKAGKKASNKLSNSLSRTFEIIEVILPDGIKDPGDLNDDQILSIFKFKTMDCVKK